MNKNPILKKINWYFWIFVLYWNKRKTLENLGEDEERGKHTDGIWEIGSIFFVSHLN